MRYLILGAGALGGYFGGVLQRGGAEVGFLVRPRRAAQLAARGLVIKDAAGECALPVRTVAAGEITAPYDVVFLACKAYDLDSAIEAIAPAVGPGTAILPVLNGMRHIDRLCERFGAAHVLGGMTIVHAVLSPGGEVVRLYDTPDVTQFGELGGAASPRCEAIRTALAAGGVPSTVSDNIMAAMWGKFCGFCCNGAISTLTRALAGEIAASAAGAAFVAAVFDECTRAAAAEGYPPPEEYRQIIPGMYAQAGSAYRPSIAVDLAEGRPTEAEHTIGDLVSRAKRNGIDVPILQAALCNLQIAEARRQHGAAATT